jgi:hypothetical protein
VTALDSTLRGRELGCLLRGPAARRTGRQAVGTPVGLVPSPGLPEPMVWALLTGPPGLAAWLMRRGWRAHWAGRVTWHGSDRSVGCLSLGRAAASPRHQGAHTFE